MNSQNIENHEVVALDDLKPLTMADGLCLTAVVPLPNPAQIETRIKKAIRGLETKLKERAIDPKAISGLLEPIHDLAVTSKANGIWGHALMLFRSPDLFRHYLLPGQLAETQMLAGQFHVLPLLFALSHDTRFHLLALSQHHVRLLHCTQQRVELEMARGFPVSLEAWMNTRRPDHVLASRSSAGPSVGAMKGVVSGMSADREREDEYLRHFFIEVDKGVIGHLRSQAEPLVLAGVEYELAIYRRINSYSATLDQSVNGSPDGVSDRTLHARAMEVVMSVYSEPVQKALADLHEFLGTARSSTDPRTVVQAAFQGRVMDLLIPANAEFRGTWNDAMQDVEAGDEDLVNAAAVQTIRHGGSAFVLKETDMPVKTPMAALFRF